MTGLLEDAEDGLSGMIRQLVSRLRIHWHHLEEQIEECTHDIELNVRRNQDCQTLLTIPGIGALGATALIAAVGNATTFCKGRELAAWLGLVPRQHSTDGKSTLLGIGKRKNTYVRRLFVHGARSVFHHLKRDKHNLGVWMTQLEKRVHRNVVIAAIANKMAPLAWAVLSRQEDYRPGIVAA